MDLSTWASQFLKNQNCAGTIKTAHFGTLHDLTIQNRNDNGDAALESLCEKVKATHSDKELLLAAYTLLGRTIRNRDAHAYVPNVRDDHLTWFQISSQGASIFLCLGCLTEPPH